MRLEFASILEGFGGELKCPACGFNYPHHKTVDIYERSEDASIGLHINVKNGVATSDTNLDGNPSQRRHGLTVQFLCEGCKAEPVLSIAQHKGNTWLNFE